MLVHAPKATGRMLVTFDMEANGREMIAAIDDATGDPGNASIVDELGIGIVEATGEGIAASLMHERCVQNVRPEFWLFAPHHEAGRMRAMRDVLHIMVDAAFDDCPGEAPQKESQAAAMPTVDTPDMTWGVRTVGANSSLYTGRGIRVAVLDTGIDMAHPDFAGRVITTINFSRDDSAHDGNGHGTHCAGTIFGPISSSIGPRYGVAPDAELYVAKVLANNGAGREFDVISGIDWAIKYGCQVISMSLGRAVHPNEPYDPLYERIGQTALSSGCLIVAAAGNESERTYGHIAPVGSPANAPSIMAVGALDNRLAVSPFSCGGGSREGSEVDISGPGSGVLSAWPMPRQSRRISGTSMATPHVAGVAALIAQSDASLTGRALWDAVVRSARRVGSARDYGAGLVQAPR